MLSYRNPAAPQAAAEEPAAKQADEDDDGLDDLFGK